MAYTNSKLVNYVRLSPNHSGQRGHKIDKITIHHMSGNLSVEGCGAVFAPVSRQASSNYGIGSDGRVGLYVEEKNHSWCSSSWSNDDRAITIEVANDGGAETKWHVSDKALNKLIELCVDICKRNGISKLNYTGNTSGNLTMHRWFAATDCPGPYLAGKFPYIAEQVNKRLAGKTAPAPAKPAETLPDIFYRVKTKASGLLPEVKNLEDFAGIVGQAITGFMVRVSKGSVKYRAHIKGGSWLPYVTGYNIKDAINGFAGDFREIDAIEIIYTAPSGKKYKAKYRVAPLRGNYYDWQKNNEKTGGQDGYAGLYGRSIDRLQITLIKG